MGASSEAYRLHQEREEYAREAAIDLLLAAREALYNFDALEGIWKGSEPVTIRLTREQLRHAIAKAEGK